MRIAPFPPPSAHPPMPSRPKNRPKTTEVGAGLKIHERLRQCNDSSHAAVNTARQALHLHPPTWATTQHMHARYTARRPPIGAAGAAVCVPFPTIVLPFRAMLWRGLADVHGIGLDRIGLGHGDLFRVFDLVAILPLLDHGIGMRDELGCSIVIVVQIDCYGGIKRLFESHRQRGQRKGGIS